MSKRAQRNNERGNSRRRRRLRQWLLDTLGDGHFVMCWRALPGCAGLLTYSTVTLDRWPVPGSAGGKYRRGNVIPACRHCNMAAKDMVDTRYHSLLQ